MPRFSVQRNARGGFAGRRHSRYIGSGPRTRSLRMNHLMHWLSANANVLAVLVTAGVAVLVICCLECSDCSKRDKDDLFKRHGI